MKFSKNINNKRCAPKIIFFNGKRNYNDSGNFWRRKLSLKVRILWFLTTNTQLTTRLKNFLRGWLLVMGLKEGLVECATVYVKSVVIISNRVLLVYGEFTLCLTKIKNKLSNLNTRRNFLKMHQCAMAIECCCWMVIFV